MTNSLQLPLAFGFVLVVAASAVFLLISSYEEGSSHPFSVALRQYSRRWEFTPSDIGGFSWVQLSLASVLSLFLEVLMIRWVTSEVPVFAYFKNIVLIGCFLGFGLGYSFCRRKVNLLALGLPICLLVVLIKVPWPALRSVMDQIPYLIGEASDLDFLGSQVTSTSVFGTLGAIVLIAVLFALVAFVFIPLGQIVGWSLETAPDGVLAYTVNVVASLAGILLYSLLCFRKQPPAIWFALSGIMLVLVVWRVPRWRWLSATIFLFCVAIVSLRPPKPAVELWSPYQKITVEPKPADHPIAYELQTNGAWYQQMIDLSPGFVSAHPELFRAVPAEANAYNIPYRFYPQPASVLVLGAGTGNDVAAAIRNGGGRVVAVEIDPLILDLGRRLHFERPYASPRVKTVLDDARSYIQNSHDQFDLIVFSLLDSHTTASYYSNIRIDNYVYTLEAFQAAKRLLKPDGVFIVKFWATRPWIAGRLYNLVSAVFGRPPVDMSALQYEYTTSGRFFIAGDQERIQKGMQDPVVRDYVTTHRTAQSPKTTFTTDDWPYFYQRKRGIPLSLVALSVVLVLFCWRLMQRTSVALTSSHWHFFLLGAGFMLLEAQIVSKMALLFGVTWLVNSIVISGLLLLIAAANVLVHRVPSVSSGAAYIGIFISLAAAYFIPLQRLFLPSIWLRALLATTILCLPVFFAGIVFIRSFRSAAFEGKALGANLFGALVGGLLESMSLWTGIRSLVILAAALYAASYLTLRSETRESARRSLELSRTAS